LKKGEFIFEGRKRKIGVKRKKKSGFFSILCTIGIGVST